MESKRTAWATNKWRQTDCLENIQTDDSGCIANCSLALKVRVTLNASDRRDNGCIQNYSPLLAMALSCPNWHKLFIDEVRFHVFTTKDCTDGKEDIIALRVLIRY